MFGDSWGSYDSGGSTFGGSYDYSNNFQGPGSSSAFDYDLGFDFGTDIFAGFGFDPGLSGIFGDDILSDLGFDSNTFDYGSGLFDTNLTVFHQNPDIPVTYFNPAEENPNVFLDPSVVLYDPGSDSWRSLVDQNGNPTDESIVVTDPDTGESIVQLPDFVVNASDEFPIAAVQPGAPDDMIENPLELTFRNIDEAYEQDQGEDQNVFGFFPTDTGLTRVIRNQLKENAKGLTSDINEFGETVFNATDGKQYVVRKPVPGGQNRWVEYEEGVTEAPTNGLRGAAEPITFPSGTRLNPYTGKIQYSTRSEVPTGMESSTGPLAPGSRITTTYEWDPANSDAGWQVSDRFVLNENEEVMILPENVSLPEPDPVPPDLEEAVDFERPELSPTNLVYEDAYDPTTYEVPQELITTALERIDNDLANSETLGVQFQTLPVEQRETFEELVRGHIENNETFSDSTDINANLNQALAAAADAVTQELAIDSSDDQGNIYNAVNSELIFNDIVNSAGETLDQTLERINAPSTTFTDADKREEVQKLFTENTLSNLFFIPGSAQGAGSNVGIANDGINSFNLDPYNTEDLQNQVLQSADQLYNEIVQAYPEYGTPSQAEALQKRALKVATIVEVADAVKNTEQNQGSTDQPALNNIYNLFGTSINQRNPYHTPNQYPYSKSEVMGSLMLDGIALGDIYKDSTSDGMGNTLPGRAIYRFVFNLNNGFDVQFATTMDSTNNQENKYRQNIREQGEDAFWKDLYNNAVITSYSYEDTDGDGIPNTTTTVDESLSPALAPADASGFTDYSAGVAAGRQEAIDTALGQGIQFTQGDIDDAVTLATQGLFTNEEQQAAVQAAVTKAIEDTINRGDIFTQAELDAATTLATNNATQAVADAGFVFNQANIDAAVEQGRLDYINQGYTYKAVDVQAASEQGYAAGEAAVTAQFAEQGIQFTQADITKAVNSAITTKEEEFGITLSEAQRQSALEAVENYKDQGFLYTSDDINDTAESLLENQIQQGFLYRPKDLQDRITQEVNAVTERLQDQFDRDLSEAEIKAAENAVQAYMDRSDTFTKAEQEAAIQVATDNAVNAYIDRDDTYTQEQLNNLVDAGVRAYKDQGYTFRQDDVDTARQTGFTEGQTAGIQTGREQVTTEFEEAGIEFTQADITNAVTTAVQNAETTFGEQLTAAELVAAENAVEEYMNRNDTFTLEEAEAQAEIAASAAIQAYQDEGFVFTQTNLDKAVNDGVQAYKDQGYIFNQDNVDQARQEGIDSAIADRISEGLVFTQSDITSAVNSAITAKEEEFGRTLTEAEAASALEAVNNYIAREDTFTLEEAESKATIAAEAAVTEYINRDDTFNQTELDSAITQAVQDYQDQGYTFTQNDLNTSRQEGFTTGREEGYEAGRTDVTQEFEQAGIEFTQADINNAVTAAIDNADIDGQKQEAARLAVEAYIRDDNTIFTQAQLTAAAQAATDAAEAAFEATGQEFTQVELDAAVQNGVDTYKAQGFTFTESDVNTARDEGLAAGVAQQVAEFEARGIEFTQADIEARLLEKETEFGVTLSAAEAAATSKAISDTIARSDIYTQEELNTLIDNASQTAVQTYIDSDETIYTEADVTSRITDAINSLTAEELTALMPEVEIYRPDVEAARAAETDLLGRRDFRFFQEGVENLGQAENQAKLAQWLEDGVNENTYRDIERQVIAIGVENDDTFTMADRILDTAVNGLIDGGLDPLNSIAAAINLAEGITGANIADIPNVGQMLGDSLGDKVDDTVKGLLNRFTPEFFRNAIAQQTGYLGQDVNIVDNILADANYAAQIRTGLPPATEQLEEYNKIVFESLFVDPSTGEAAISWDSLTPNERVGFSENASDYLNSLTQPEEGDIDFGDGPLATLFKPIIGAEGLASSAIQGIGNFLEDVAFNQKKFVGGLAPKFLLDTAIGGFTGVPFPYSFLSDMLLSPFVPRGQALSDYLYEQGINPLTATMDDISFFGGGALEDIPEGFLTRDEDFLRDALQNVSADTPSAFSTFVGEGTLLEDLLSGETNLIDFVGGLGSEALNNIFGGGIGDEGTGISAFQDDPPANTVADPDPDGPPAIFDEGGNPIGGTSPDDGLEGGTEFIPDNTVGTVDGSGNINTGTNMEEDDTEEFDLSYEIAKSIGGTEFAEGYRNVGLQGVLGITDDYQEAQARASLGTQADIAEQQQSVADRLRDLYLTSNIGAIDRFGQPIRDAVSSLRPEATAAIDATRDIFEQQRDRALGRLSARDLAEARNEAFIRSQATGRFEDPVGQLETLAQLGNVRARNEQLAINTGSTLANQEAARQGDLTSLIIGQSPFTAGIQQVDVPFGGADLFNIGAQNYQNVAQQEQYNQAMGIANQNMAAIPQASQPSGVQKFANFANDLSTGLAAYQALFGPGDGSGGFIGGLGRTIGSVFNPTSSGSVNRNSFNTNAFVPQQQDYSELYNPLNIPGYNTIFGGD